MRSYIGVNLRVSYKPCVDELNCLPGACSRAGIFILRHIRRQPRQRASLSCELVGKACTHPEEWWDATGSLLTGSRFRL